MAKEIEDFGEDEYPNMICVESGHVSTPVILLPGTAFEASQILQVCMIQSKYYYYYKKLIFGFLLGYVSRRR